MAIPADVVGKARPYLGMRERPARSNRTQIGEEYGWNGVAWCHEAVSVWAFKAGLRKNVDFPWTASTPVGMAWFQAKRRWYHTPAVGDFVYYSTRGRNGSPYHVELVIAVGAHNITTIGGNTSGHAGNVEGNGDGCYEKTLSRSLARISGYGRPFYDGYSTGDDDMPIYVSLDKTAASRQEELKPGAWQQIYFDQTNSKGAEKYHDKRKDFPSFVTGAAYYQGEVYLRLHGIPAGASGQCRAVYTDAQSNKVVATCPIGEFTGSDGDTYIEKSITGFVPKNAKLRIELVRLDAASLPPVDGAEESDTGSVPNARVVSGQVRLMVWES